MARVLIVDDERSIVLAVRDEFLFEGFEVESAADGPAALRKAVAWRPDVILLDLMLPGMNGFEICRRLRPQLPEVWIIVLTARGQEADRVTGFEAGADDYVTKPFSLRELVARVKVGLRRQQRKAPPVHRIADLELNLLARTVTRAGKDVKLTHKEFDILALLAEHAGEVIPRDEFCDRVWGPEIHVTQRVIDTHVAALRRKLEADPNNPRLILSVRGVGYKLGRN